MKKGLFIFTNANRLVHGFRKRYRSKIQDSRPGIVSTISTVPNFTKKRPRKPETVIKDGFAEEMEHGLFGALVPSGKTGLPFQIFGCPPKFSPGTTQEVVFRLLPNQVFRKLFLNGKQPCFLKR